MSFQIGDQAPDFEAETTQGRIRLHEWIGRLMGGSVLPPQGLHARLHDGAGLHGETQARV